MRNGLLRQAFELAAFCRFWAFLVERLILFVVWYIIYVSVIVDVKKRVQEWNIYQLDRQPINGASQLEEYKCYALKVVFLER